MEITEGLYILFFKFLNLERNKTDCKPFNCISQVQWDEPASIARPERVSPWEIEPFVASVPPSLSQTAPTKNKRPRPPSEISALGKTLFLLYS